MKWFKHDTDASIDSKLQSLMLDYGAEGYGLYWYCLELIAQTVTEKNITFELEHDARIIARNLGLTHEKTLQMMKYMVELKLFEVSSNDKLKALSLAKRLDSSMTSSPKFRSLIKEVKDSHDNVMTNHDSVMNKKRREENIYKSETLEFAKYRKEMKSKMTERAMRIFDNKLKDLEAKGHNIKELIDTAIENGWKTVYEPNNINILAKKQEDFLI